jgi:hypothetical protein
VPEEAASVYVYEALAFNRSLNAGEIQTLKEIYKDIYYKSGSIPIPNSSFPYLISPACSSHTLLLQSLEMSNHHSLNPGLVSLKIDNL